MKKLFIIILLFLTILTHGDHAFLFGKMGRMVTINFALENMDITELKEKRKADLVKKRMELLKIEEQKNRNIDLSIYSTEELISRCVSTVASGSDYKNEFNELSKRSEELKLVMRQKFDGEISDVHYFTAYLGISYAAGEEFLFEIAKKCLFHPDMVRFDTGFFGQETIFRILEKSGDDESEVLDRLIAEGRLEKGSELEAKWRKRFSQRAADIRRAVGETGDAKRKSDAQTAENSEAANDSQKTEPKSWLLIAGGALVAAGLVLLLRIWMRSHSDR